jgi:hypothetical protein
VVPLLCRALALAKGDRQFTIQLLLRKVDPSLPLPKWDFNRAYSSRRTEYEENAERTARAMRQLGPDAVTAYRTALRELLASTEPEDRRFAAYAIGGYGLVARDDAGALLAVVENPVNEFGSDSLPAALALARIGEPKLAARAFVLVLKRKEFQGDEAYWPQGINAWEELRKLPLEARAAVRNDIPADKRRLLDGP